MICTCHLFDPTVPPTANEQNSSGADHIAGEKMTAECSDDDWDALPDSVSE